jgi:Copper transport outer membrane protein, MctB
MVGFRYHLVSLVAVFLALAVGLVLGATALSGVSTDNLRGQVTQLSAERRTLQGDAQSLRAQVRSGDEVAAALGPRAVAGALRGHTVVLVGAPQTDGDVTDAVQKMLQAAGARVTGRVQLATDLVDPRRSADVRSFVTGGGQPAGFRLPETDDAGVLGAALLSYALVRKGDPPDQASVSQVLAGFAALQMLRLESGTVTPAEYAVVVASARVAGADAGRALGHVAGALGRGGHGAVVAGTAAATGPDGLLGVVRADTDLAAAVSTVDDAGTAAGQVGTVFALLQAAAGKVGQYGRSGHVDAPFPPT